MPKGVYDRSKLDYAAIAAKAMAKRRAVVPPVLDLDEEVVPGLLRRNVPEFVKGLLAIRNHWIALQRGETLRQMWERRRADAA